MENENIKEKVNMIMRQTNLSEKDCYYQLKCNNDDHIKIIKEYNGINFKTEKSYQKTTSNQERFRLIRNYLDSIDNNK